MDTLRPEEVAVPLTSSWWTMKCTLEEKASKYIFQFQRGTRKEYQPGMDALEAALSLKLDKDKPSPEVVKFVNDYGPTDRFREVEMQLWGKQRHRLTLEEGHLNEAQVKYRNKELKRELYITWHHLYRDLDNLQRLFLEWKAKGSLVALNEEFNDILTGLHPRLAERDEGVVWEFGFNSLYDALVGLLAQSIVEGRSWKTCPYCKKQFINGKRRFHTDQCREAYHTNKKSDALGKERQRLYQTLRRRLEKGLIDQATFEKVRRQLKKATTLDGLKAVERKNSSLYARFKPGPTLNGGPRQHKDELGGTK